MAIKVTATRFGGVSAEDTSGSLRAEVEYWLTTDTSKHGRFSVVVPQGNNGSNNNLVNYLKSHLATYLNTKYAPLQFGSGDILVFGF